MAKNEPKLNLEPKPTLITFLLDKSASMGAIWQDTIDGFNTYLDGLQKAGKGIKFTRIQFDTVGYQRDCVATPLSKVTRLDKLNYQPRASTPLIDAVHDTIAAIEASLPKFDTEHNIIVCIQTDGHENSSTRHLCHRDGNVSIAGTWDKLKALVEKKTEEGWVFNFMGTGIDAYDQGGLMGVSRGNIISSGTTSGEIHGGYAAMATSNTRFAVSGQSVDAAFTQAELSAANNAYDPGKMAKGVGQAQAPSFPFQSAASGSNPQPRLDLAPGPDPSATVSTLDLTP